ncbi:hypothetical protein D3C71_1223350 [compost metagenome]
MRQHRAQHRLRALAGLAPALFIEDGRIGQRDRAAAGVLAHQGFEPGVGLHRQAAAGLGLAQRQRHPDIVRVVAQQLAQVPGGLRGGTVAQAPQGQPVALRLGQPVLLRALQAFVFPDDIARGIGTEHAQALACPLELARAAAAERVDRNLHRGRQQRIAPPHQRIGEGRIGRVHPLLADPAGHLGGEQHRVLLHLLGAGLGLADAGGVDRVGLQEIRDAVTALVAPHRGRHALEEAGHRIHVVAAAGECADAQAVGLGFVGAGVVDLALLHQPHAGGDRGHGGVAGGVAAGLLRGDHCRQHAQQDRNLVALGAFHPAQHMLLGDVGDFVGQHRGHFVLALGSQHQARVDPDIAAESGKGVDLPVLEHEEGVGLTRLGTVGAQPGAHGLQPVIDQRVIEQIAVVAQFAQHHPAVLGLPGRGQ